jgi:hypothetical protein
MPEDDGFLKIGFSLERCIRDIVGGKVSLDQVVVVISRTAAPTEKHLREVIDGYVSRPNRPLFHLDKERCYGVAIALHQSYRLFQPRLLGSFNSIAVPADFVWMNLFPTTHVEHAILGPLLKQYLVAAKLATDSRWIERAAQRLVHPIV